jgi:hypothetical protein
MFDKLGRELLKLLSSEKDEIEEQMGRDKLKCIINVADGVKN